MVTNQKEPHRKTTFTTDPNPDHHDEHDSPTEDFGETVGTWRKLGRPPKFNSEFAPENRETSD